jgi:hypothetical protein
MLALFSGVYGTIKPQKIKSPSLKKVLKRKMKIMQDKSFFENQFIPIQKIY